MELWQLDATAQAELVRTQQASPSELCEAAIARIERCNPELNAVVLPLFEQARAAASGPLPHGPFRGVPLLIKDLLASVAGVTMTSGSRALARFVPPQDSELVARFRRAGFVLLGKTNTPEFGILPTTEPQLFGATRNPWDRTRTAGGSSGGSAAAVAAGMVAMAHANDGGGSIRIPASCCGLFGLKPTRARTTLGPALGDIMSGLVCEHVVTRSVRDSAALLDAVAGPAPGDPYVAPPPARPFAREVGAPVGKLRIALVVAPPTGSPVDPECVAAVRHTATLCETLGHEVVEASPALDAQLLTQTFFVLWTAGAAATLDGTALMTGQAIPEEQVEALSWALATEGRKHSASTYLLSVGYLQQVTRTIARFMEQYDVLLTPTLAEPPVPIGTFAAPSDFPMMALLRAAQFAPFTALANVTGQPAMSVPLAWSPSGLPLGSHFVGRYGEEATLFRLAAQLEAAQPWGSRWPETTR